MKNKKLNCKKVQYFDFTLRPMKNTTRPSPKKNNIVSMMTFCQGCKGKVTRKNEVNGFHLCDKCNNLTAPEIYLKVTENFDKQVQKYVNWDSDLDYLYYHFWLDDTK